MKRAILFGRTCWVFFCCSYCITPNEGTRLHFTQHLCEDCLHHRFQHSANGSVLPFGDDQVTLTGAPSGTTSCWVDLGAGAAAEHQHGAAKQQIHYWRFHVQLLVVLRWSMNASNK
jgi:hypothetical protein